MLGGFTTSESDVRSTDFVSSGFEAPIDCNTLSKGEGGVRVPRGIFRLPLKAIHKEPKAKHIKYMQFLSMFHTYTLGLVYSTPGHVGHLFFACPL